MAFRSVKVLIATIGLSLGSAAIAENLVHYVTTLTGTKFYIDLETVRWPSDNSVVAWIKLDQTKDKTVSSRTERQKLTIDCSAETYGHLSVATYRANGTVIGSYDYKNPEMSSIIPGTPVKELFDILCPR